jgi:uncharacterized membrane protein YbhN (UPF0104 family)
MIPAHLGALALVVADILIRAVRLRVLLGRASGPAVDSPAQTVRFIPAVRVNAYGDAACAVTPGRVGGDPARFFALRGTGVATPPAVVALAVEHVVDMSLAILVALTAAALLGASGFAGVGDLVGRLVSSQARPWLIAVAALMVLAAVFAFRLRHRFPPVVTTTMRETIRHARTLSLGRLLATIGLTAASMLARVSVLPVLLAGYTTIQDPLGAFIGSFALIYAQLLLPTPAGAGGVELGFVVGFAPLLTTAEVATFLVAWRAYSLVIPAGLGAVLFAQELAAKTRAARLPPTTQAAPPAAQHPTSKRQRSAPTRKVPEQKSRRGSRRPR